MNVIRAYCLHIDLASSGIGLYHYFFNIKQLNGQSLCKIGILEPYNMRAMQTPNPLYIYIWSKTTKFTLLSDRHINTHNSPCSFIFFLLCIWFIEIGMSNPFLVKNSLTYVYPLCGG
jgi:hypothetical protein